MDIYKTPRATPYSWLLRKNKRLAISNIRSPYLNKKANYILFKPFKKISIMYRTILSCCLNLKRLDLKS